MNFLLVTAYRGNGVHVPTVIKIYCSIKLPKVGLLVILNQEIESSVYAKKLKNINRWSNKTVLLIYDLCYM